MKRVEVLYFDGCPNVDVAADHARKAVAAVSESAEVQLVRVDGNDEAVRRRFLGSPTIRVDAADVDASAWERTDFGMQCRVYWVDGKVAGAPPVAWIEEALRGGASGGLDVSSDACCAAGPKSSRS